MQIVCSQEDESGTSRSTRQIGSELGISERSVWRMAQVDLNLIAFQRRPSQVLSVSVKRKRLDDCKNLSSIFTIDKIKTVFFININNQNDHVYVSGRNFDVTAKPLLVELKKFAKHVMVSVRICFGGKGKLHLIAKKAKVSAKCYVKNLLPHLIIDCKILLRDDWITSLFSKMGLRRIQPN